MFQFTVACTALLRAQALEIHNDVRPVPVSACPCGGGGLWAARRRQQHRQKHFRVNPCFIGGAFCTGD